MQGVVATRRQVTIDRDQILHAAHLAREHDALVLEPQLLRLPRALQRGGDERLTRHHRRIPRLRQAPVLVHHAREELGIEAAPVHPDANRLGVAACELDHGGELLVAPGTAAYVAGIYPELGERFGARGVLREQSMTVEVEIPDQRHFDSGAFELLPYMRHRGRGFGIVDGYPDKLRSC